MTGMGGEKRIPRTPPGGIFGPGGSEVSPVQTEYGSGGAKGNLDRNFGGHPAEQGAYRPEKWKPELKQREASDRERQLAREHPDRAVEIKHSHTQTKTNGFKEPSRKGGATLQSRARGGRMGGGRAKNNMSLIWKTTTGVPARPRQMVGPARSDQRLLVTDRPSRPTTRDDRGRKKKKSTTSLREGKKGVTLLRPRPPGGGGCSKRGKKTRGGLSKTA